MDGLGEDSQVQGFALVWIPRCMALHSYGFPGARLCTRIENWDHIYRIGLYRELGARNIAMECDHCGRRFDKPANLRRHANRKNPCRPRGYTCEGCGQNYASYQSLWQHRTKRCGQAATGQPSSYSKEQAKANTHANGTESANACMCVLVCECSATLPNKEAREDAQK